MSVQTINKVCHCQLDRVTPNRNFNFSSPAGGRTELDLCPISSYRIWLTLVREERTDISVFFILEKKKKKKEKGDILFADCRDTTNSP